LVQKLAPKLAEYFPAYANKHATEDAIEFSMREYARHLIEQGVATEQIPKGMRRAEKRDFCPNPYQFAMLCKPTAEDLKLPSFENVFNEITKRFGIHRFESFAYSHLLVELIAERIGVRMYQMDEVEARKLCKNAYDYWVQRALEGSLPAPRRALPLIIPKEPMVDTFIKTKGYTLVEDKALSDRLNELRHQSRQNNKRGVA
jgi:hypothetical protein